MLIQVLKHFFYFSIILYDSSHEITKMSIKIITCTTCFGYFLKLENGKTNYVNLPFDR